MLMVLKLSNGIQLEETINFGSLKKEVPAFIELVRGMIQACKLAIMERIYRFIKGKSFIGKFRVTFLSYDFELSTRKS